MVMDHSIFFVDEDEAFSSKSHPSCAVTYLARENVSKGGESIVQSFVVNALVQVLNKHIADTRLS